MEKEPKWFHQVTQEIKGALMDSSHVETHIFPDVNAHMYTGAEEKIALYISDWITKAVPLS